MDSQIQDAFVRQRRSLFLTTIILTIVFAFGINGTEVRVGPGGGTGLTIDLLDTRIVYLGLVVIWGWFLYRYWQYWLAVRPSARKRLDEMQEQPVFWAFARILNTLGEQKVSEVAREGEQDVASVEIPTMKISEEGIRQGWKSVSAWIDATAQIVRTSGAKTDPWPIRVKVSVTGFTFYRLLLKTIIPFNIRQPYFTEYPPPVVFVVPPLITAIIRWESLILPAA